MQRCGFLATGLRQRDLSLLPSTRRLHDAGGGTRGDAAGGVVSVVRQGRLAKLKQYLGSQKGACGRQDSYKVGAPYMTKRRGRAPVFQPPSKSYPGEGVNRMETNLAGSVPFPQRMSQARGGRPPFYAEFQMRSWGKRVVTQPPQGR